MTEMITKETKKKIHAWQSLQTQLQELKKKESDLRDEIIEEIFPDIQEGTTRAYLGRGYSVVVNQQFTRKVDEEELKSVMKKLGRSVKKKDLIKTSVSLIKKGFDALTDDQRTIFEECITVSPRKPSLKIEEPKED